MFSLVITLISIVLVALLAIAATYYLNRVAEGAASRASATTLVSQAAQIAAAGSTASVSGDAWPSGAGPYFTQPYLANMPVPPQDAYLSGIAAPVATDWTYYMPDANHFVLSNKIRKSVCMSINAAVGLTGIPATLTGQHILECFGPHEPYTFFYDPADSHGNTGPSMQAAVDKSVAAAQNPSYPQVCPDGSTINSGTCPGVTALPPDTVYAAGQPRLCPGDVWMSSGSCPKSLDADAYKGSDVWMTTDGTRVSLVDLLPGTRVTSMILVPAGSSTPVAVPVSRQPLPTPAGWAPADQTTQQVQPTKPAYVSINSCTTPDAGFSWTGDNGNGPGGNGYSSVTNACASYVAGGTPYTVSRSYSPPAAYAFCDSRYGSNAAEVYSQKLDCSQGGTRTSGYLYRSDNSYYNTTYCMSPAAYTVCPAGTILAGGQSNAVAMTSNASCPQYPNGYVCMTQSNYAKPSDGQCNFYRNTGVTGSLVPDTTDPDCANGPTTPDIHGRSLAGYACSASDPNEAIIKVNADGTLTLIQSYGSCGGQVTKTCTATSTNAPGYYQAATMGAVSCQ